MLQLIVPPSAQKFRQITAPRPIPRQRLALLSPSLFNLQLTPSRQLEPLPHTIHVPGHNFRRPQPLPSTAMTIPLNASVHDADLPPRPKDVGILAIEMYFPRRVRTTCLRRVRAIPKC